MNNQFSENLKKIRKDHNLSQEQLADELGVSRQAISKWESSTAYPEMDKIIAICDKFSLNIDDLLHKDIKEIKGEEESKNKLNKSINDFLTFITDTVNLFSNMDRKSKFKCLLEQVIIILLLVLVSMSICFLGNSLFFNLLEVLPYKLHNFLYSFFESILILFCLISSLIILVHIFKTRYLDYYNKIKKDNDKNLKLDNIEKENIDTKNKILFKQNENKIIIRDPKHSEYRFINGLFRLSIGIIKFFALCFASLICFFLIFLFTAFIISFVTYKNHLLFLGEVVTLISTAVITIIILLIILNFIFNRKNAKKQLIWSFIVSLVTLGCGLGFIFLGMLDVEVINKDEALLKIETVEYEMQDETFFNLDNENVRYVERDIDNIKVEYEINKYFQLNTENSNHGIISYVYYPNPMKLVKEFIKELSNKKIICFDDEIYSVVIYASKENIEKLKSNQENYFQALKENEDIINYYENKIEELEKAIDDYNAKFEEYERMIAELNLQLEEYRES